MDEFKFYSYIDDKSILVITPKNKLVRIKCPFAVMDAKNQIFQVDAVKEIFKVIYYKIRGRYVIFSEYVIFLAS